MKLPKIDSEKGITIAKWGLTLASGICALASHHVDDLVLDKKLDKKVVEAIAKLAKK